MKNKEYTITEHKSIAFPFSEGDDYWVIESDGTVSDLSCWDEESELMHLENPNRRYFTQIPKK